MMEGNKATCRTCGASLPGRHVPSILDPDGLGNPGHKVAKMDSSKERYCQETSCIRKVFQPHLYCDEHVDSASTVPESSKEFEKELNEAYLSTDMHFTMRDKILALHQRWRC